MKAAVEHGGLREPGKDQAAKKSGRLGKAASVSTAATPRMER
ncbi:hypothetical protein OG417_50420 [Actinoallomurus sp. NBC_01490]|nr:hypothetical protein [Actinoallomurus sp. NBC_01490]